MPVMSVSGLASWRRLKVYADEAVFGVDDVLAPVILGGVGDFGDFPEAVDFAVVGGAAAGGGDQDDEGEDYDGE